MSIAVPSSTTADEPAAAPAPRPRRHWRALVLVVVVALAGAVYVTHGLWQDPYGNTVAENVGDQAFFEWALAYGVQFLTHGGDPFFTKLMNAPDGVNLAANTSITAYAVLFAPLTRLAGPQITFVLILTLNLAGSAVAWFLFLRRWVVRHAASAAVAGLFCGFAPGFIAHANGHLNWTSGWIAPVVLWRLFKLREGRRVRNGVILGLLLAIGFSIAAEGLFFTALAAFVFVVAWAVPRATRGEARAALPTVLGGLAVAGLVTFVLLAYPLYMHFAGPETFGRTGFSQKDFSEDFAAYFAYATLSVGHLAGLPSAPSPNPTEQTSFFGLPLILLVIVSMAMLWRRAEPGRRATLRALAIVAVVFFVISLGPRLHFFGVRTHIPLPYAILLRLPLFDAALPLRFSLVVAGVFAVVLALAIDELLDGSLRPRTQTLLAAAFAIALVPILPLPIKYAQRAAEPAFIADGTWKQYVPAGGTLTSLPFAINVAPDAQRWQAYTMAKGGRQFRIPDGYFLGPDTSGEVAQTGDEISGRIGALPRQTDWLFLRAAWYGYVAQITNEDRAAARADFAYWGVDAVFLPDSVTGPEDTWLYRSAVELTATDLLGPPEHVDGVLVWRIRQGVDPVDR